MKPVALLTRAALIAIALAVPAASVFAQAGGGERGQKIRAELEKRFAAADVNGDGKLTRDEAKAKMPRIAEHFDEIDTAHAGTITLPQIESWVVKQAAARKAQK
jgi:hypothetical protein